MGKILSKPKTRSLDTKADIRALSNTVGEIISVVNGNDQEVWVREFTGDAIKATIASLPNGGTIRLLPGVYTGCDDIIPVSGLVIKGAGAGQTVSSKGATLLKSSGNGYVIKNDSPSVFHFALRDLMLHGNNSSSCLLLNGTAPRIYNVTFLYSGAGKYLVEQNSAVDSCDAGSIDSCWFYGGSSVIKGAALNIERSYFNGGGATTALKIDGHGAASAHAINVIGNLFESFTTPIIDLAPTVSVGSMAINHNKFNAYIGASASTPIIGNITGVKGIGPLSVMGNFFHTHSSGTVPDYSIDLIYAGGVTVSGNAFSENTGIRINVGAYDAKESCRIGNNGNLTTIKWNRDNADANDVKSFSDVSIDQDPNRHFAKFVGGRFNTTNDTPLTVFKFPMEAKSSGYFTARVMAQSVGGSMLVNAYEKTARAQCLTVGGGATVTVVNNVSSGDMAGATCVWGSSAHRVTLTLTGIAATTINWVVEVEYQYRANP